MKHGSIIPLSTNIKHTTINTFVEDLVYCFSEKMIPTKKVDVRPKRRKGKELIDTFDVARLNNTDPWKEEWIAKEKVFLQQVKKHA